MERCARAHVRAHADESGLVYCLSRRDCEVVCEALGKQLGARARVEERRDGTNINGWHWEVRSSASRSMRAVTDDEYSRDA